MARNNERNNVTKKMMTQEAGRQADWQAGRQEADQLAIYKHSQGVELNSGLPRTTPGSGQNGTCTCDLQISSPAPQQLTTQPCCLFHLLLRWA